MPFPVVSVEEDRVLIFCNFRLSAMLVEMGILPKGLLSDIPSGILTIVRASRMYPRAHEGYICDSAENFFVEIELS